MASQSDIYQKLIELPIRRYADILRNRIADLNAKIAVPALFDQYPGKQDPWVFSSWFGPISLTAATAASPSSYTTPMRGNPRTGRDAAVWWTRANVSMFYQWGWTADPSIAGVTVPIRNQALGGLFSPVISGNGGGSLLMNFDPTLQSDDTPGPFPNAAFEIALYDKKRGRYLTDGKIPLEFFAGGTFCNKDMPVPTRFEPDTEIEPRLYTNEFRLANFSTDDPSLVNAALYVNLTMIGYSALEQHEIEQEYF